MKVEELNPRPYINAETGDLVRLRGWVQLLLEINESIDDLVERGAKEPDDPMLRALEISGTRSRLQAIDQELALRS